MVQVEYFEIQQIAGQTTSLATVSLNPNFFTLSHSLITRHNKQFFQTLPVRTVITPGISLFRIASIPLFKWGTGIRLWHFPYSFFAIIGICRTNCLCLWFKNVANMNLTSSVLFIKHYTSFNFVFFSFLGGLLYKY